jgi:hypothetical protein
MVTMWSPYGHHYGYPDGDHFMVNRWRDVEGVTTGDHYG